MSGKTNKNLRQEFDSVGRNFLSEVQLNKKNLVAFDSVDMPSHRRAVITNVAFYLAKKMHSCVLINLDSDDEIFFSSLKITDENRYGILDSISDKNINIVNNAGDSNLYFISRGSNSNVSIEDAINNKKLQEFLQKLCQKYDFVLLNLPDSLDSVTVKAVSKLVTGVVFVVNSKSRRKLFFKKVQLMKEEKVQILGSVFIS